MCWGGIARLNRAVNGELGVNQPGGSVRQNSLRLGERSASTQLLKTMQTDGKTDTDKNTDGQNERTIIGEGVTLAEKDFSRKIASAFLRS